MKNEYMLLSSYRGDGKFKNRKVEVLRTVGSEHNFGIRMYINDNALGIEWFNGHNEAYADSAAENYVLGIKDYTRTGE